MKLFNKVTSFLENGILAKKKMKFQKILKIILFPVILENQNERTNNQLSLHFFAPKLKKEVKFTFLPIKHCKIICDAQHFFINKPL